MQSGNKKERGWIVAAIAASLVIIIAVVSVLFQDGDEAILLESEKVVSLPVAGSTSKKTGESLSEISDFAALETDPLVEESHERKALGPTGIFLSGRVTDKVSGEPVPVYGLRMCRWTSRGAEPWKEFLTRKIDDRDGRFHIPLEEGGRIRLWVRSASHQVYRTDVNVPEDAGLADQQFELDPGAVAAGIVVDDATGSPVEGALVAHADLYYSEDLVRLCLGFDTWVAHAMSDGSGRFRLSGLDEKVSSPFLDGKWQIAAVHPDFAEGVVSCTPGSNEEVLIRLKPGYCFFGKVLDDEGNPASSAMVCVTSKDIPLPRPVLTDSEGNYRTAPVRPGLAFVSAGLPHGRKGAVHHLTEETRRLKIGKSDMEVNFGSSAEHVTWTGTVRDRDGRPMPHATITLAPSDVTLEEKIQSRLERSVESDEEGRFEIGKMAVNSYLVDVEPSSWAHDISIGKLTFEKPGVVEQDIHIAGGEIHGIVREKATKEPIAKRGYVSCSVWEDQLYRRFSCPIDEQGRFSLLGLPAGTHRIGAISTGFPRADVEGIVLGKDQILYDVQIEVFEGGKLNLRVDGFAQSEVGGFGLNLGLKGGQQYFYGTQHFDANGSWEITWDREPGVYITELDFKGIGTVVREFEIFAGRTTPVLIHMSNVKPPEGSITVSGNVTHPGGDWAEKVRLFFYSQDASGKKPHERSRSVVTDSHGLFEKGGFWPGRWAVSVHLGEGNTVDFPDLVIAHDSPPVVTLDLVLSTGVVTGTLRNAKSGKLMEKDGVSWWVFLNEAETGQVACEIQGGQTGDRFTLKGVPAGDYTLLVKAKGYRDSTTGPYSLHEGDTLDVGEISLDPGGIVILEVVSEGGESITEFELTCDGETVYSWYREEVSPGRFRYYWLPAGKVTLIITAEGYTASEIPLTLEPGVPSEERVVLSSK